MYGRGYQMGFGPPVTPPIIKQLIIANCVVFLAQVLTRGPFGSPITHWGGVNAVDVWTRFYVWQPFTYMWLHSEFTPWHILMNMFMLWMFGSQLAMAWGEKRFLQYYLVCGVGAGVVIATLPWLLLFAGFSPGASAGVPTVGASGAVMGVLLAFSFTWPDRTIQLLFPPVAFKAIWLIPLLFLFEWIGAPSNVSHVGHLGGVLVGWAYLVNEGKTPGAPTFKTLEYRWRRWTMRRKLRAVQDEEDRRRRGGGGGRWH